MDRNNTKGVNKIICIGFHISLTSCFSFSSSCFFFRAIKANYIIISLLLKSGTVIFINGVQSSFRCS
nr:MAG TPA: hypothetical protein [Caudoviricetes sp.]